MKVITNVSRTISTYTYNVKCYDTELDDVITLTLTSEIKPLSASAIKKAIAATNPTCKFLNVNNYTQKIKTYTMSIKDFMSNATVKPDENKEEN